MVFQLQKYAPLEEVDIEEYSTFRGIYRATIHITDKCNLKCLYCGFNSGGFKKNEIDYEILNKIIPVLAECGVRHLDLSGGEATLRKDLFDILTIIDKTPMSLGIISNGTLITLEYARRLAKHNINSIKISLDGLKEEHDKLRGKGNYERAIKGIRNIINYTDIKVKVLLTLTKSNIKNVGKLSKLLADIGIWIFVIRKCDANGRAIKDYVPSEKDIDKVYRQLLSLKECLPDRFIEWSFINPFPSLNIWANNLYIMLEDSGRHLTILSDGDIMVDYCSFCSDGVKEGSIYEQNLYELIQSIINKIEVNKN